MPAIYVIGDIHGCCKTFKMLLLEKLAIKKADTIYCVGDYIDRGNDSKGVIDFIIDLRKSGYEIITLRGNHEQMMLDSTNGYEHLDLWLKNGGTETLSSFGITSVNELPEQYISFFTQTELFVATKKYIFVHAGLNFRIEDPFTDKEAMLWTRDEYFDPSKVDNRLIVHGHTPIPFNHLIKQISTNKINIDGGCVYKGRRAGHLIALQLPGMKFISTQNIED